MACNTVSYYTVTALVPTYIIVLLLLFRSSNVTLKISTQVLLLRGQNTFYGYEGYFEQILAKIAPVVNFTIDQYLLVGLFCEKSGLIALSPHVFWALLLLQQRNGVGTTW